MRHQLRKQQQQQLMELLVTSFPRPLAVHLVQQPARSLVKARSRLKAKSLPVLPQVLPNLPRLAAPALLPQVLPNLPRLAAPVLPPRLAMDSTALLLIPAAMAASAAISLLMCHVKTLRTTMMTCASTKMALIGARSSKMRTWAASTRMALICAR